MTDILNRLVKDDQKRSPDGRCYDFEDGLDGFFIHADGCKHAGHSWVGGSSCINMKYWKGRYPEWVDRLER